MIRITNEQLLIMESSRLTELEDKNIVCRNLGHTQKAVEKSAITLINSLTLDQRIELIEELGLSVIKCNNNKI